MESTFYYSIPGFAGFLPDRVKASSEAFLFATEDDALVEVGFSRPDGLNLGATLFTVTILLFLIGVGSLGAIVVLSKIGSITPKPANNEIMKIKHVSLTP